MNQFRSNLAANFVGTGWAALIQLACVPFFIKLMGIESYGLVGFYITMLVSLQVLDLGISPTMNRELARYSVQPDRTDEMRDFVRTLEVGYWGMGIVLGGLVVAAAPMISHSWINAEAVPEEDVTHAVMLMGALLALQWPLSFYQGGLRGLQRQVVLNGVKILTATLSSAGAVFVLWALSPKITAFFAWQVAVAVLHVILITRSMWSRVRAGSRAARFDLAVVRRVAEFAAGMSGIALFSMILVQMDKIVLSKMLSLEMFGYYVLAGTVVGALHLFISPIFEATFPRLSALVACGDEGAIRNLYHSGTQLMAVLILPIAIIIAMFSFEVVHLWTGDANAGLRAAPIVTFLIVGTAINGLMHMPYALQLAYGWTSIGVRLTVFKVVVFLPLLIYMARHYGVVGAASVWALLNVVYLAIALPLTHRRLLQGEAKKWLVRDVGLAFAAALAIALAARWLLPADMGKLQAFFGLAVATAGSVAAAIYVTPHVRTRILEFALNRGLRT